MNAWIIFGIAVVTSPAFGQTVPAKTYTWTHPWFKSEIKSATPPTWPYRVIEEKNGVVKVEVTPPNAQKPAESKPAPPTPPSTVPAPQPKEFIAIPADKEEACKKLGPVARAIADLRQKGTPLHTAEAGIAVLLIKEAATQDTIEFSKGIVRAVYNNKLTTENAEEIIVGSCKIMVYAAELKKN